MLIIVAKDLILSLVQLIPLTVKGLGAGVGRAEKEFGLNVRVGSDIKEREKKNYFLEKYSADTYIWPANSPDMPSESRPF